jgi:cbb3-type cytochrome oxidase maturation protein
LIRIPRCEGAVFRPFNDEQIGTGRRFMGDVSLIYTAGIGILLGVFILGFFVWGLNTGAFDHSEDAKYVLFRDDDDDDD